MWVLVIDEADEMLRDNFQIREFFEVLEGNFQVIVSSATMPHEVFDIAEKFMYDPVKILVKRENLTLDGIRQFYVNVKKVEYKLATFEDLYDAIATGQSIIFVNTTEKLSKFHQDLELEDFAVSTIHSDQEQSERKEVLDKFRTGKSHILLSTDILGRGIDIQQVSLVINYDLPKRIEEYFHRIGRVGRYGRKGVAINFVTDEDIRYMKKIEHYYNTQIDVLPSDLNAITMARN